MSGHDIVYGLDFGTSNSAIAAWMGGELRVIAAGVGGRETERSLVYFPHEPIGARFIGEEAIARYIDEGMAGRLIQSVKTLLPDPNFDGTEIYGIRRGADWLASLIIAEMKRRADAFLGADVRRVVMGRPAIFDEDEEKDSLAEKRLRRAAEMAGFEEIVFQREPIAAGFAYERRLKRPELVLVADLGAGTSDFTLARLDPSRSGDPDRRADILAAGGVHQGGDDYDAEIVWGAAAKHFGRGAQWRANGQWLDAPNYLYRMLSRREEAAFLKENRVGETIQRLVHNADDPAPFQRLAALVENNLSFGLFQAIEGSKIALSDRDAALIEFRSRGVEVRQPLKLSRFDALTEKLRRELEDFVTVFLQGAGLVPSDVDAVFLTGGGSFVRSIRGFFAKTFGEERLRGGEAFTSVASGLALSAPLFFGASKRG